MTNDSCCRFCKEPLTNVFADLGMSPLSNSYISKSSLSDMEKFYPLKAYVCDNCLLVQLEEFESPEEIFSEYAYFSSYSTSWLEHSKNYVDMVSTRFNLGKDSQVVEIASNDGYLLQYFVEKNIKVLGIEPAENVAKVAQDKGIPSLVKFFGIQTASELAKDNFKADLLLGNNVLAHVPDINDFVGGIKKVLSKDGVVTMEFPHLYQLMKLNQFDTIYHEHFSYLSLYTVQEIFAHHGLTLFDVDEIPTHGGSIRVYAKHAENRLHKMSSNVSELLSKEKEAGLHSLKSYLNFRDNIETAKRNLLSFLLDAKEQGKTVVGYGAPAKGNTLLNYCGIREDFIDFTVDRSPHKQGKYLPGVHIPICEPEKIAEVKPDYLLILPWNLKDEIMEQMSEIRDWGGQFIIPIPQVEVVK